MKENNEQRIDRYLNQELSESEQRDFEQEMEQNPELKAEFVATKQIIDTLRKQEDDKVCEAIRSLSMEEIRTIVEQKHSKEGSKKRIVSLLAVAAVAASLLLFWFRPYQYAPHEVLSPDLIPSSLNLTVIRGGSDRFGEGNDSVATAEIINNVIQNFYLENQLDSINSLYNKHENALLWRQLPLETQSIIAYALIRNNQYDQAAVLLLPIDAEKATSQTAWLKMIVLLKSDHRASARLIAELLIKRDDGYREAAEKVLVKLNKRIIL